MAERRKSANDPDALAGRDAAAAEGASVAKGIPADAHDPDAALWVRAAIAQLDEEHREILLLREYEELSYDEIAAVAGLPVNTVRSRLFRARLALKELLVPEKKATADGRGQERKGGVSTPP
jgi:RNA polymerase sigma-70 factor (ECF subfamily)